MNSFQVGPILRETGQVKLISARMLLEYRRDGCAIKEHVCLNIAPYFCKPEGENDRATLLYTFGDGLHKDTTFQSLFQADEGQGRICVGVVPSCVCQFDNRRRREFCVWIERPAQFIQY